jgi:ATP-dependent phosphofructokinase / diphosphate-dependent phosphofructokinase
MFGTVAIICGGGPAPGINAVISSISRTFLKSGYRVLGIHDGYKGLLMENAQMEDIDFHFADRIHNVGGSAIRMSRFKPKDSDFNTRLFEEYDIRLLVTIGGDDTASTANRLTAYLKDNNLKIQNIHVPKTIDNDLPLPEGISTFGYQSAKQEGVEIGTTVYEDARTSGNWFVISAMGREAGHLAFGIGSALRFPMIVIPEMFNKTNVTIEKIIRLLISAIIKRKILGINYGVVIVSEGVFHFMDDAEIEKSGVNFTYDDHGHPELGNVSKAHIFNVLLNKKLKEMKVEVKSRPVELGYEIRCIRPNAYDLLYCSLLGLGVKRLFDSGYTGCMVTADHTGKIAPLFLKDVEDENGKIKPRLVNMESEKAKMVFDEGLQYLTPGDYEEAKAFIPNPEYYDFLKILNW